MHLLALPLPLYRVVGGALYASPLPSVPLVNFLVRPVEHVDQRQGAPFESNQVSIDFITYVTGRERNETRLFSRFFTTRKMFKQVRKLIILNKNSKNSSFLFDKSKNRTQFFRSSLRFSPSTRFLHRLIYKNRSGDLLSV